MTGVVLLLIGDGRDNYRRRTLASLSDNLLGELDVIEINDSGHRLGFAGAIQEGWNRITSETDADYVFHVELDFTFNNLIPLRRMIALLERQPHLAQVALKRQPWNPEEKAAGGIVELHPDDFAERSDYGATWSEHRRFFTTNPSVYRASLCRLGWPQEAHSEGMFTHRLLADPLLRFAFWGGKHDPPLVTHIGDERIGRGY